MPTVFTVAACVLMIRNGQVLALRRAADKDAGAGLWEALSGRVEVDEDPLAAARREALEETGLTARVESRPWASYAARRLEVPMIVIVYRARPLAGEVRLSDEHDAFVWCDADGFAARSSLAKLVPIVRSALAAPPPGEGSP